MIITSNSSILTNKTSNNLFSKLQAIKHKLATMILALVFFALSSPCWSALSSPSPTTTPAQPNAKAYKVDTAKDTAKDATKIAADINADKSSINTAIANEIVKTVGYVQDAITNHATVQKNTNDIKALNDSNTGLVTKNTNDIKALNDSNTGLVTKNTNDIKALNDSNTGLVTKNTNDIKALNDSNTGLVTKNTNDIKALNDSNTGLVTKNTNDIKALNDSNTGLVTKNTNDIKALNDSNTGLVTKNTNDIKALNDSNTGLVTKNTNDIKALNDSNTGLVTKNTNDIKALNDSNTGLVTKNTNDIKALNDSNTGLVTKNTNDIKALNDSNTGLVTKNTNDIASNTSDIKILKQQHPGVKFTTSSTTNPKKKPITASNYLPMVQGIDANSQGTQQKDIGPAIVTAIKDKTTPSGIHKAIADEINPPGAGAKAKQTIKDAVDARVTAGGGGGGSGSTGVKVVKTKSGKIIPQNTPQIQQAAVSILPPTESKQIAAKVTQHIQGTALHKAATTKFKDKAKQDDYLMPDSSNSKVIASNQAGNHIITHVNNRIANRSPSVASAPTAKSIKGISSGAIADNLQIWMSAGYQHTREKEQSQTDHSKIGAKVFSVGLDTDVDDHATLGVSYANVKSKVDSYGPAKADKASDDIKTNAVSIYLAITEAVKQSSVAVIYAHNKHDGVDAHKKIKTHTSNVVGANYSCDYSFYHHGKLMPGIILSGQLAVMSIKINSHQNKFTGGATPSNCTPKQQNVIFNFGVATTFIKHQQFKNDTQVTTKIKVGYNYAISSGDNSHEIELAANNPASRVKVKAKEPSANNFNLGLNFDFVVSRNMHIDLDLQYSLGDSAQAYGASLVARYHF